MIFNGRQRADFGVSIICSVLAVVVVAFRFWARAIKQISWRASDYTIALSTLFMIGFVSGDLYGNAHGAGQHTKDLSREDLKEVIKAAAVTTFLWILTIVPSKLAILFLYLEIFVSRPFRIACWTVFGLLIAYTFESIVVFSVTCQPFSYAWNQSTGGHCLDVAAFSEALLILNVLFDVIIFMLPQPVIWKLQMQFKKKLAVSLAFGFGVGVIVITIIRLTYNVPQSSTSDRALNNWYTNLTGTLESSMSIILACLPTLQPVFALVGQSLKTQISPYQTRSGLGRKSTPSSSENPRASARDSGLKKKPGNLTLHSPFSINGGADNGVKSKTSAASGGFHSPLNHDLRRGDFRRLSEDEELGLATYPLQERSGGVSGESDVIGVRKDFEVYEEWTGSGRMV